MQETSFTSLLYTVAVLVTSYIIYCQNQMLQNCIYMINCPVQNKMPDCKLSRLYPDGVNKKIKDIIDIIDESQYKKRGDVHTGRAGFSSIIFSRFDFEFTKFSGRKLAKSHTISVSQKTGI